MFIDFSQAPEDPIARLVWLSGARESFNSQVETEWRLAYFNARFSGRFDEALALRLHGRKRALAYTRAENENRGRMIRWADGR